MRSEQRGKGDLGCDGRMPRAESINPPLPPRTPNSLKRVSQYFFVGVLPFLAAAVSALTLSVHAFKSAFALVAALVLPAAFTAALSVAQGAAFAGAALGALP